MELPALRQDLRLRPGTRSESGEASWLLYDPLRHQYFSLSRSALKLIRLWRAGETRARLNLRIKADGLEITAPEVDSFINFIEENFLIESKENAHISRISKAANARKSHWLIWLIHNYLFFKIPLLRPDAMLTRLLPKARLLVSRPVLMSIYLLGGYGFLSVIWQWEQFFATFLHFFTWQGVAGYALALIFVKAAHELGHALVAKHYGLRVSSIGLAFLVLFPVLYTDNTDAWRLTDSRKRLRIVLAGLLVELHIAFIALFGWAVLEDGTLRSAAFFLATSSLLGSLLINLSPFMRFDGYYALADYLKMDNMQPRAFAVARWQLRQWLFALPENVPEPFEPWRHSLLLVYSYLTWIYRLILFIGIALLVYHFAFKLLGIILFIIEIFWFVLRPIWNEMKTWWTVRRLFSMNQTTFRTILIGAVLVLVFFVPWRGSINVPGVIEAKGQISLYPPEPARLKLLVAANGQQMQVGQLIAELESPALAHEINLEQRRIRLLEAQIAQQAGSRKALKDRLVYAERLIESRNHLQGLQERAARLQIRAPMRGRLDISQHLHVGQWLNRSEPLGFIADKETSQLVGYIAESKLVHISEDSTARFIANNELHPTYQAKLVTLDKTATSYIPYPALLSTFGGPIAIRTQANLGNLGSRGNRHNESQPYKLENAYFKAVFSSDKTRPPNHTLAGRLQITTPRYSLAGHWAKGMYALLIRESGF